MPDDPNQGDSNTKSYGSNFEQSGSGTPLDPSLQNNLSDVQNFIQAIATEANTLLETLNKAKNPVADMSRDFNKFRDSLKFAVETSDDVVDRLKKVLEINKKFATTGIAGLNKKSYAEVKKWLEVLQEENQKLVDDNWLSREQQAAARAQVTATTKAIGLLNKKISETGDELNEIDDETLWAVARAAKEAGKDVAGLAMQLSSFGKHKKDVADVARILGSKGPMGKLADIWAKSATTKAALKEWRQSKRAAGGKNLDTHMDAFRKKYGLENMQPEEIKAWRRTAAGKAAGSVTGNKGVGGAMDMLFEKLSGGSGGVANYANRVLESGGGKAFSGIITEATGAIGEMAEAAQTAGAEFAVVYEGVKMFMEVIDKITDSAANQEYFKRYGTTGMFAAGETARESVGGYKNFARAGGMAAGIGLSTLRVNEKGNQEILDQFKETGLDLSELAHKLDQNAFTGITQDARARTLGGVQQFAYTTGRQAGMDVGEGAKENLKYLMQFGQTQQEIETFFKRTTQEVRTAGISVTKYLQIVDSITDGFDRFHKTLGAVVDTMKVLDSTGIATSQDLQDAMGQFLKGPQKSLEQMAATLQQMPRDRLEQINMAGQARLGVEATAAQAQMTGFGLPQEDLTTIDGMTAALQDVAKSNLKGPDKQTLSENIQNLMKLQKDINNLGAYLGGKQSLVDTAANLQDATLIFKGLLTAGNIQTVLGKSGVSNKQALQYGVGARGQMIGGVFGLSPEQVQGQQANVLATTAITSLLQNKPEAFTKRPELETLYGIGQGAGLLGKGPTAGLSTDEMQKSLQTIAGNQKFWDALLNSNVALNEALQGNTAVIDEQKKAQDAAAQKVATPEEIAATITKASDSLAQVMQQLIQKLSDLIDWMDKHLPAMSRVATATLGATDRIGLTGDRPLATPTSMALDAASPGMGTMYQILKNLFTSTPAPVAAAAAAGTGTAQQQAAGQQPGGPSTSTSYTYNTGTVRQELVTKPNSNDSGETVKH